MSDGDATVVLGLSFGFHDAAAALIVDGEVVAAAEEERFSRVKHDASIPIRATEACLRLAGVEASDVGHVVYYEKPLVAASRFLATKQSQGPRSIGSFFRDAPDMLGRRLLCGYQVARMLSDLGAPRPPRLQFVEHHLSHAASAFYPSPFEAAAVMTVDGIGEWATASIGAGRNHRLEITEELRFPDSLGLAYSLVTSWCGFRSNDDEYKVMGLAPYGEPRFVDALSEFIEAMGDGSVHVRGRRVGYFSPGRHARRSIARRLDGPPRPQDQAIGQREADLAASIQALTETTLLSMARHAHERTGESRLCLAGGVALNCVANGRLMREGPFDEIWVQPAAGDAGGAIGAALAYWHLGLGRSRTAGAGVDGMNGAFLGPDVDGASVDDVLQRHNLRSRRIGRDEMLDLVVDRLVGGEIVAVCRGRMEFGPRALGHRSLLADPRSASVRHRLNSVTKAREQFRPFAPAVLEDHCSEWFGLDQPSPYMLMVAPVRDEHRVEVAVEPATLEDRAEIARSTVPACTHVDGSARVQTVDANTNPDFHELLERFYQRTGCPMLVNTSFNRAGEPIVASADDAVRSASAASVDALVLGDRIVDGAELDALRLDDDASGPSPRPRVGRRRPGAQRHASSIERFGLAWAAAAVPLTIQLEHLGILDHVGIATNWIFVAALLAVLHRRTFATSILAIAAFAAIAVAPVNGEHRFIPMQIAIVVQAGVATGALSLRRRVDGEPRWVPQPSVAFALPVIVADVVLLARAGVKVPALVLIGGMLLLGVACAAPGPWSRVEGALAGATRLVGLVLGRVIRVLETFMGGLGRIIALVVMPVVFGIVVLLPWAYQRVTFGSPLWAPRRPGTRWIERDVSPLSSQELWFNDPGPRNRIAAHRLRRIGALVVVGCLAAGLVVVSRDRLASSEAASENGNRGSPIDPNSVNGKLQAQPWFAEWNESYRALWDRGTTSQYAGAEFGDVKDRYLTWIDGVRRSWEPEATSCRPTVDVWLMGGSAAFGTGQRDDHTVSSELARVAWSDGYRLRIQNRAVPGDVAWVEQRRLERAILTGANPPEFVVFYDGFNDVRAPMWAYMAGFPIKGRLLATTDRDLVPVLGHLVEEERGGKRIVTAPAVDINARPMETVRQVDTVIDAASFQYRAADTMSKEYLAGRQIPSARFFQPNVQTRNPARAGDFAQWPLGRDIMAAMRQRLPEGTVDLSDVFNSETTPYYSDDVHTIEAANVPLARAMWTELRPQITKVARPGGTSCS